MAEQQESGAVAVARPDLRSSELQASFHSFGGELLKAGNDEHRILKCETSGSGLGAEHTPRCSCGWRGRVESESNDYCHTNLAAQERAHLSDPVVALREEGLL